MRGLKVSKVISFFLISLLFIQQTGFVQAATVELDLPSKASRITGAFAFERSRPLYLCYPGECS